MPRKARPITLYIFVTGLLSTATGDTARPSECFPGPDFKPAPGTEWHYQIDPATNQGCWYLKELGPSSRRRTRDVVRSSRSVSPSFTPDSTGSSSERGSERLEGTPAATSPQGTLKAWFSSTFTGLFNPSDAYSTEPSETDTTGPRLARKRYNELSAPRQPQRSKSEEQSKTGRVPQLIAASSILEAAGDKPVLSPPALQGQELQKALEAVGEKDVHGAPSGLQEDWQKDLYEEFLRWRLTQVMSE